MPSWAALVFATPLFGLQLQAPDVTLAPRAVIELNASIPMPFLLQTEAAEEAAETTAEESTPGEESAEQAPEPRPRRALSPEAQRFANAVRLRREIGDIHRTLGIVTWASMAVTVGLGMIQYYNLYGFGAGQDANPCVRGEAIFGQDQCWGTPWPHLASAAVTTALYSTTMTFSFVLLANDPNNVLGGEGQLSDRMRAHAVLAIIHALGMVTQAIIGIGIANQWFGDRANNYDQLQTLATVHQVVGWTTWVALGAAGAIMLF